MRVSHVRVRLPFRYAVRSPVRSWRSAPIRPATSVSINARESTRMPSRRTSPSCSSRSLPTNADRSILGFAIASTPPCRPSPAKRELTERCAMAVPAVYAAAPTEFPPRAGTLTVQDGDAPLAAIAWGAPHDQLDAYLSAWVAGLDDD